MGAPFWSNEEKHYFLQQIVPRSHYANGYYESTGRSFEDLAQVMQRDLDDRNLSRRTYNGDLLFQHWYQKVKPTLNATAPSARAAAPMAAAPQGNAQASDDAEQSAATADLSTDEGQITEVSEADPTENAVEPGSADSVSTGPASFTEDVEMGEIIETNPVSSRGHSASAAAPSVHSANDAAAEPVSGAELPPRGHGSPSATRSTGAAISTKRSRTQTASRGQAAGATKKAKRGRKSNARLTLDSGSDDIEFDNVPRGLFKDHPTGNSSNLLSSMETTTARTHLGLPLKIFGPPLPSNLDEDDHPHRLRYPVPIPGEDPFTGPSRGRDGARGLSTTSSNAQPFRVPGSAPGTSSTTRRPFPPAHSLTQDLNNVARLHRVATAGANNAFRTQGNGPQNPVHNHRGSGAPVSGSGSASASTSGPGRAPGSGPTRIHPVTGERLGEVVLQGPTFMTYCPSCQRPF